jgi:hypothetical protein
MNTAMVLDSGIPPLSTVEEGGRAAVRLITDPALDTVTGKFFDGLTIVRAHPHAYDQQFRRRLRQVTDHLLATGHEQS